MQLAMDLRVKTFESLIKRKLFPSSNFFLCLDEHSGERKQRILSTVGEEQGPIGGGISSVEGRCGSSTRQSGRGTRAGSLGRGHRHADVFSPPASVQFDKPLAICTASNLVNILDQSNFLQKSIPFPSQLLFTCKSLNLMSLHCSEPIPWHEKKLKPFVQR